MRTYYVFKAASSPDLRGFTYDPAGERLPAEHGPWTLVKEIGPDDEWTQDVSRAVVATGILDNGYYLWGPDGSAGFVQAHHRERPRRRNSGIQSRQSPDRHDRATVDREGEWPGPLRGRDVWRLPGRRSPSSHHPVGDAGL